MIEIDNLTRTQARALQSALSKKRIADDDYGEIRLVAGVDAGFEQGGSIARGAAVLLSFPQLEPVDQAVSQRPVRFPYIPGLLSFRESPVLIDALGMLCATPDMLLCDGQGTAHPRRFGIACHLGIETGLPSIGVAKSRLTGIFEEPGFAKGNWTVLRQKSETIGAAVRSRHGTRPIFVSPGHRVTLASAVRIVLACCTRFRLPETTRSAHKLASG